eukprot:7022794-Alexandrium_andersonii.AAC.1
MGFWAFGQDSRVLDEGMPATQGGSFRLFESNSPTRVSICVRRSTWSLAVVFVGFEWLRITCVWILPYCL